MNHAIELSLILVDISTIQSTIFSDRSLNLERLELETLLKRYLQGIVFFFSDLISRSALVLILIEIFIIN
jgi:hypothetical protein